jgi:hypothetical protein
MLLLYIKKLSLVNALCFWLILVSCQNSDQINKPPEVNATYVSINTLRALPTLLTIFEYNGQVSDEKLLFSVIIEDMTCNQIGESFLIKLIFKNLTDKAIKLSTNFSIAVNRFGDGGNISPFITSSNGKDVYSLADSQLVDIFETPSKSYYELDANQSADFSIEYSFPDLLTQIELSKVTGYVTPIPGQYYLRFVYFEPQREVDTWYGAISSNKIEICLRS